MTGCLEGVATGTTLLVDGHQPQQPRQDLPMVTAGGRHRVGQGGVGLAGQRTAHTADFRVGGGRELPAAADALGELSEGERQQRQRFRYMESGTGFAAALHTTEQDTYILSGVLVTDTEALAQMDVPDHETYEQFIMFDNRMAQVETVTAELTITQPREISLYARTFKELSKYAVHRQAARKLIAAR